MVGHDTSRVRPMFPPGTSSSVDKGATRLHGMAFTAMPFATFPTKVQKNLGDVSKWIESVGTWLITSVGSVKLAFRHGSSRGNSQAEAPSPSPSPRKAGARGPEKTTDTPSRSFLNQVAFRVAFNSVRSIS